MQISIMEISMSLNGNLGLSWGITQPTEKSMDDAHGQNNRVIEIFLYSVGL